MPQLLLSDNLQYESISQVVADFVSAINGDWLYQWNAQIANTVMEEIISCFPTMPQTSSALALWLVKLDALIAPYLVQIHSEKATEIRTSSRGMCCCILICIVSKCNLF